MELVQGSLEPSLTVTLTDGAEAVKLSQAASARLRGTQHDRPVFDAVIPGPLLDDGKLERAWVEGETDVAGRIWVEAVVVWPGGREQSFQPVDVVDVLPAY